jgi:hypothetical protein
VSADLTGYATESWVESKNYLTEHQSLEGYAKLTDIPDVDKFITEIPSEYVTDSELTAKGYLTEHQSLEGLATEKYVDDAVSNIEIPEVDLQNYYTKPEIADAIADAIVDKADSVPFTDDRKVTKPIGNFAEGESVKGLTIAEILAKLLGLSSEIVEPDQPDIPEEQAGIVESIITKELPMYAINDDGMLSEIEYKYTILTEEDAAKPATNSCFYQIKDAEGNVIESGYQELQINNDEVYYIIALPKEIYYTSMVSVKAWNDLEGCWTDTGSDKPALTRDADEVASLCDEAGIDISHIDTAVYTVWAMEGTPDGSIYRFVINE